MYDYYDEVLKTIRRSQETVGHGGGGHGRLLSIGPGKTLKFFFGGRGGFLSM